VIFLNEEDEKECEASRCTMNPVTWHAQVEQATKIILSDTSDIDLYHCQDIVQLNALGLLELLSSSLHVLDVVLLLIKSHQFFLGISHHII